MIESRLFVRSTAVICVLSGPLCAQEAERAAPVFEDGQAQVVEAFAKPSSWIREALWVETAFDSDGDGTPDRMHVDVTRPRQTETEGLKVPVVYETSPYFTGVAGNDPRFFWDPRQELGAEPPPRSAMPPVRSTARPDRIANSEVRNWVPRGFAVVHSCSPGTGLSQGCPTIGGENEALAPKAVIDWLCGRAKGYTTIDGKEEVVADWCSGKVGMIGASYNGTLPIAAAATGVEGLAAIVPIAPNTSYYLYYRSNGLVRHPGGYMGEDIDVLYDFVNSGDPARRDWCNEHVRDGVLKKHQDRATGDFNDFWFTRDYLRDVDKIRAATLMAHGLNDWNVMPEHSVRVYAALKQRAVPCLAFFHQGGHEGAPPLELVNRWFTRFLYGVENGIETGPKSWIVREDDAPTQPTTYADYPHPDAAPVTLHLRAGGGKVGGLALGAAASSQGKETLVDDAQVHGSKLAQAAESPHRLLYATPPLVQPLHLSGTARITLRLACSKPATNLSVWLVTLPWQGTSVQNVVTRGWADPQNRNSLTKSEPLVPGEFVDVTFDLQPDDQVLEAGKQLALMVFASDRDFTLWPPPGTELTVDLDATTLVLPVVGGEAALRTATGADK
ncbi:MAG: Xaa-Pro dipeptidyl-peptidase [Planctomycetes bacterium]|nr:Xaa-Pro dipeptidyl-peptidase [Planctomycetota bacterium]